MASLLPKHPTHCPFCFAPLHVAASEERTFFICPSCLTTFVGAGEQPSPFRLGESLRDRVLAEQIQKTPELRDTPQASSVRAVPERCDLTEAQRATSERLLQSVFKEG